jgi:hypothetical protein
MREWKSIDLVVFYEDDNDLSGPVLVLETKVDDGESDRANKMNPDAPRIYQTERYVEAFANPSETTFWYLTLGASEYQHEPREKKHFKWIKLRDFEAAVSAGSGSNPILCDWRDALTREIRRQDAAIANRTEDIPAADFRAGTWNIYVLGALRTAMVPQLKTLDEVTDPDRKHGKVCPVYFHGTRPDTIFTFGWTQDSTYAQINFDGMLNIKVGLAGTDAEKQKNFEDKRDEYLDRMKRFNPKTNERSGYQRTKTMMSINVGLGDDPHLHHTSSRAATQEKLWEVLQAFYLDRSS